MFDVDLNEKWLLFLSHFADMILLQNMCLLVTIVVKSLFLNLMQTKLSD